MKKIITLTICMALICSSVVPSYAASNAVYEFMDSMNGSGGRIGAYTAMQTIISYLTLISNQGISTQNFLSLDGDGNTPADYRSFQDVAADILNIATELDVSTISGAYTIKELLEMIGDSAANIQVDTDVISSTVSSINTGLMTYRNSFLTPKIGQILTAINKGLNNMPSFYEGDSTDGYYIEVMHLDPTASPDEDDSSNWNRYYWNSNDSKMDAVIHELLSVTNNQWASDIWLLKDFDSQLSIWDSQGNTLTQSTWTPTSGFNGLYKYLAFTQRDVARLTHVYASDEEIAARDAARQNQTAVVNNFVDSNGVGSVSSSDLGDMASVSGSLQSNFDTGASVSGVFAFFSNGSSTNWFSQATKDALDTNQTRSNSSDTPLLDAYYEEIYDLLGIGDDNR